jgi:cob(I)alamin adenosyltransferase
MPEGAGQQECELSNQMVPARPPQAPLANVNLFYITRPRTHTGAFSQCKLFFLPQDFFRGSMQKLKKGYIQVYTGNGKGKTTAAIGLAVRAAGAGLRVLFVQFFKKGEFSEIMALRKFKNQILIKQFGTSKFIINEPSSIDKKAAQKGFIEVKKSFDSGFFDLIILDEIFYAINLKLIQLGDVIDMLINKPQAIEIVLTGRKAPLSIKQIADLITEMKQIKHYYNSGIKARRGIEY